MMHNFELAIRSVEEILPSMTTDRIQEWRAKLCSAINKIDYELQRVTEHVCNVCMAKEFGPRSELPAYWREKGDLVICFRHEDKDIADVLSEALAKDEAHQKVITEESLDDLMNLL